jgi:succinate-semialdehyde dehydrogenase/glutarate-semialdehyde dehydrogenase
LVNGRGVDKVDSHVRDAVSKGARVLVGGKKLESTDSSISQGTFYEPTVLVDLPAGKEALVAQEETFGPLAALFKFNTDQEVVDRANDTDMGLAGYFYTKDVSRVNKVAEALQVGMVGVNTGALSQPCIPFGGVKQSGFGREGGKGGIDEYMVEKVSISPIRD